MGKVEEEIQKEIMDVSDEDIISDSPLDIEKDKNPPAIIKQKTYFVGTHEKKKTPLQTKQKQLDRVLTDKLGPDMVRALEKLVGIAMYDPDQLELRKDKDGKETLQKKRNHFYNSNVQMQALTLLVKYFYGNPRKEIQIDQNVDVKIEKKVADLTKLINDNEEKIRLVKG